MAQSTSRVSIERINLARHALNVLAGTFITTLMAALTSWVLINWVVGCGEIHPLTGYAKTDVCVLHPINWRN